MHSSDQKRVAVLMATYNGECWIESRYARDATFLKIDEDRPGAPFFKGWIDDSFTMSTNFDEFRR